MKKSLLWAALSLAAVTLPAVAEAQDNIVRTITGTRLELQARGESRVVPDLAVISAGVVTQ